MHTAFFCLKDTLSAVVDFTNIVVPELILNTQPVLIIYLCMFCVKSIHSSRYIMPLKFTWLKYDTFESDELNKI